MKRRGVYFLMALLLLPILIDAAEGDSNAVPVPADNLGGTKLAPPNPITVNGEKKAEGHDGGSQEEIKKATQTDGSQESSIRKKDKPVDVSQPEDKKKDEPRMKPKPDKTPNDKLDTQSVDSKLDDSPSENKDKPRENSKQGDGNGKEKLGEGLDSKTLPGGCDPSNMCINEKDKFIACLRVPGEDSLALSLLIQNKGKRSLLVNIEAPDSVTLEKTTAQLQAEEGKEVRVSVKDGAKDAVILLKGRESNCSLNIRNMIPDVKKKNEIVTSSRYPSLFTRTSMTYMLLAVAVIIAAVWLCMRYQRKQHLEGGARYQKVDMMLPVSSGGKKETNEADGWDNSWGDGWDDEEAPATPSKPVLTPSSKGLASRRLNKDNWKD